jgi:hypothetical protein
MIINLISGPRNVSTALMYSFAQRHDTNVKDEPFYGYYLKLTRTIHPGRKKIMNSMTTDIEQIINQLLSQDLEGRILFLKNMAHHHIEINDDFLFFAKNLFLIRNPAELIVSFAKVIKEPTMDDIGIRKSWELFQHLVQHNVKAWILDSGELLKNPRTMLKQICEAMAIPFDPNMLAWPAGPRPEDGIWAKYWYHQVHKTTGFIKYQPREVIVPAPLQPLYNEAMTYYNQLFSLSIRYK